jgi:hypothetical protein
LPLSAINIFLSKAESSQNFPIVCANVFNVFVFLSDLWSPCRQEHLGASDKTIIALRRLFLKAVREIQEGKNPPHLV